MEVVLAVVVAVRLVDVVVEMVMVEGGIGIRILILLLRSGS